jgi:hypothetical protein
MLEIKRPRPTQSLEVYRPVLNARYKSLSPLRSLIRDRVIELAGENAAEKIKFNKRAELRSLILSRGEIFGFLMEQIYPRDPELFQALPVLKQHIESAMPEAARVPATGLLFPENIHELPGDNRPTRIFITLGDEGANIETQRVSAELAMHEFFDLPQDREVIEEYWDEGNVPPSGYIFASLEADRNTDAVLDAVSFAVDAARDDGLSGLQAFSYDKVLVEHVAMGNTYSRKNP